MKLRQAWGASARVSDSASFRRKIAAAFAGFDSVHAANTVGGSNFDLPNQVGADDQVETDLVEREAKEVINLGKRSRVSFGSQEPLC